MLLKHLVVINCQLSKAKWLLSPDLVAEVKTTVANG